MSVLILINISNRVVSQELASIDGTVQLGYYDLTTSNPEAGTMQWTGSDLVGYNGRKWVSLTTGVAYDGYVEDENGNTYFTIQIGTQEWMAENLRTTKYNDGMDIDLITANNSWGKTNLSDQGAYCWYDNDQENELSYGALYNWYAVNTGELCPLGWRVPSESDWDALQSFVGSNSTAGGKLKAEFEIHWNAPNVNASNEVGFTAQPGGIRLFDGNFDSKNAISYFWTSNELSTNGKDRSIINVLANLYSSSSDKRSGYSVRCIKN